MLPLIAGKTVVPARYSAAFGARHVPLARTIDGLVAVDRGAQLSLLDPRSGLVVRSFEADPVHGWPGLWAVEPRGEFALVSAAGVFARVDLVSGERTPLPRPPREPSQRPTDVVALFSDERLEDRVLVASDPQRCWWLSTRAWTYEGSLPIAASRLRYNRRTIAVSARGGRVAVCDGVAITLYDGESGAQIAAVDAGAHEFMSVCFSRDDRELWARAGRVVLRFDAESLAPIDERTLPAGEAISAMHLCRNSLGVVLVEPRRALVLDRERLVTERSCALRDRRVSQVYEPGEDPALWMLDSDGAITVFDPRTGAVTSAPEVPAIERVAWDRTGARIVLARASGIVQRVTLSDGAIERFATEAREDARPSITPLATRVMYGTRTVDLDRDGADDGVAVGSIRGEGEQRVTLVAGGVRVEPHAREIAVEGFAKKPSIARWGAVFSRNGRWLCVRAGARLAVIDLTLGAVVSTLKANGLEGVSLGEDGSCAAQSLERVYFLAPGRSPIVMPVARAQAAMCVALATTRGLVIVGLSDGALGLIDVRAPRRWITRRVGVGPVRSLAISPDETQVIVARDEGDARVFSLDELVGEGQPAPRT